jgi:outer membrane protein assembly factor BamA
MRNWIILFLVFCPIVLIGQKEYALKFSNSGYQSITKEFKLKYRDSLAAITALDKLCSKAVKKGYLLSGIDSMHFYKSTAHIIFYLGEKFEEIKLKPEIQYLESLPIRSALKEKLLLNLTFRPKVITEIIQDIQDQYLNSGFPFCKIYLDSFSNKNGLSSAKLIIQPGLKYPISEIHVKGDSTISSILISKVTGIRKGDLYKHEMVSNINSIILQQAYLEQIKPSEYLFTPEGLEIFLFLKSKGISSINGALGLQPNPNNSKINLTGDINLKLINVLRRSEQFVLNWRNIQAQTQALNTSLKLPYLFKTSFGIDAQFSLYKRDSTFIELRSVVGINYSLKNGTEIKGFYQNFTSNVLKSGYANSSFLNLSNIKSDSYGIGIQKKSLDYIPNPTKGFNLYGDLTIGKRKSRLFDSLEWINTTTYKLSFNLDWYIPISKRNIIKLSNKSDFYYAPEIFQNELFRFGGLQTLRGFNEEEIFASSKSVFSVEYRFLLDKNSAVFAFYDQGIYENIAIEYKRDTPFGLGAGLSFGTNLGIFSISLALGKQLENQILLRNSKIHFGYIAYF